MRNHSYENEFNLHANEISFLCERMGTKTRFEKETTVIYENVFLQTPEIQVSRKIDPSPFSSAQCIKDKIQPNLSLPMSL